MSWLIDHQIGHRDADSAFRGLSAVCEEIGYDQQQFDAMLDEVTESYGRDRGRQLIDDAFA